MRTGVGKIRNRRHTMRKGPLVIYKEDNGICKAFRNLPGVTMMNVSRLNLLHLAPGGHLGRFCIWTETAFAALNDIYASNTYVLIPHHLLSIWCILPPLLPTLPVTLLLNDVLTYLIYNVRLTPKISLVVTYPNFQKSVL